MMTTQNAAPQAMVRVPAGRRVRFWFTAYTLLLLLAGTNVPTPLYRGYEQRFDFSPLVVTLVFAAYVGALIPSLLIAGPLSDAIGRRRVLLPAVVCAAAGSLVFALADGVGWLVAARLIQGVSVGAASGALTAALSELEPRNDRRRAALVSTVASVGGLGVGPLMAGLLAQYAPDPFVLPFVAEIALLVPAAIAMAALPPAGTTTRWRPRRPSVPPAVRGALAVSGIASFLAFSVIGLFLALVPTYVTKLSGSGNLALAGGSVTLLLAASIVAQLAGFGGSPLGLQIYGMVLLAVGLVLLAVAGGISSLPLLLVATCVGGAGQGLAYLGGITEINRLAPPDRHADTLSSYFVVVYLGVGVPVIGVGVLATAMGLLEAVQVFSGVVAGLCLIDLVLLTRSRGRSLDAPGQRRPI